MNAAIIWALWASTGGAFDYRPPTIVAYFSTERGCTTTAVELRKRTGATLHCIPADYIPKGTQ